MPASAFNFTGFQNKLLHGKHWNPIEDKPKACMLIVHGMAEHKERYNHFANFMTSNQISVYSYDHRGHGRTDPDQLGFISENNGFNLLVNDLNQVILEITEHSPDLPLFLFGHSMGSFVLQRYMQLYEIKPAGLIYSGSNGRPPVTLSAGIALSSLFISLFGAETKSRLLNHLTFGSYNQQFKPNRTPFDWLSRDHSTVDLYIDDPYCGFICSNSFYHQLFAGIKDLHKHSDFADHDKKIPILLISGEKDPVSNMSKGIRNLEKTFKRCGLEDLTVKLYPDGRHEMINEINREEVYVDLLQWINDCLS